MLQNTKSLRVLLAIVGLALGTGLVDSRSALAGSKVSVEGKVVLANVDKHTASFRIADVRKDVAPRKASVLNPSKYPLRIEIWNGNRANARWVEQPIQAAGIYLLRYQNGQWRLTRHSSHAKPAASTPRPSSTVRQPTYRNPSYRRITGTAPRVARGSGRVYRGGRFPVLYRVAGSLLSLYRFIRDEEDRDLIRDIIIGREIDREIERELWDRLDDLAVNLPAAERLEFERALRDLQNLDESDLRDLDNVTDAEWDTIRDELGDEVTDNAWREIESDYSDLDVETQPVDEIEALDDVGIDSLESNIDIGDLDVTDIGTGDLATTLDDVEFGDLGGGIEDIDVGDLGTDFEAGGGFEPGINTGGEGFDYDQGGFNDFGNNMGGGDWGGSDFGAPEFGGGDFGGGDFGGGDFGGGFDDFGGGGFDDFGGGFDDF
jgi:hypothetical protein